MARERDAIDNYLIAGTLRHFPHLHSRENEVAALHTAGISSHRFASGATLVARRESAALVQENCGDDGGRLGSQLRWRFSLRRHGLFPSLQLFKKSERDLRPEMEFGAVGYNEPSLVWYFRGRVKGFLDSALEPEKFPRS